MAHIYRPLQEIETGETGDAVGHCRREQLTDILCVLRLETEAAEMIPIMDEDVSVNHN